MNGQVDTIAMKTAMAFPSELGWMAAVWVGRGLASLSIGFHSRSTAQLKIDDWGPSSASLTWEMEDLITRLQQFAGGERDDFLDVELEWAKCTQFQRAVLDHCRRIPFGEVLTYGQLSEKAGHPRSARAVGNVMANNRVPLIIPCHRVVGAGGALGGFSAPDGIRLKRRLLKLEGVEV